MSESDLYELTKRKYEAQLKLEALQYKERLNSLKAVSSKAQSILATHRNNVSQMKEIIDDFNKKTPQITEKLESKNYLKIDRESGVHLKNVFDQSFEIFNLNFGENTQVNEIDGDTEKRFLTTMNKRLEIHQNFGNAIADLASLFNQKKTSQSDSTGEMAIGSDCEVPKICVQCDDTISTICSENVFASSPF